MSDRSPARGLLTRLGWRNVRHHRWMFVATFVAFAAGASIVMACGGLMETGIRGNVTPRRLDVPIVVTGDATERLPGTGPDDDPAIMTERVPLPAALVGRIRALDGVARAEADTSVAVAVAADGRAGSDEAIVHGWSSAPLAPFALVAGEPPAAADEVVVPVSLAERTGVGVGAELVVGFGGEPVRWRVTGLVAGPTEPGTDDLFVSDEAVAALAPRPGMVDNVAVLPEPGVDIGGVRRAIESLVADSGVPASVLTGGDRGYAEHPGAREAPVVLIALAGVFGGMTVFVAMFVVAGTVALSLRQRARELALLRAVGMSPGQVRRLILIETSALALAGLGVGAATGPVLGRWLLRSMIDTDLLPPGMEFRQGFVPQLVGVGAVLLSASGASLVAARRVLSARPVDALVGASLGDRWLSPVRVIAAAIALGGALALAIVTATVLHGPIAASTAAPAVLCAALGVAFLGPGITRVVAALVAAPVRLLGGSCARLAGRNVRGRRVLVAAVVTPLTLAIGVATASLYQQTTQAAATRDAMSADLRADAVVTAEAGGIGDATLDAVRSRPEVGAVSAYVTTTAFVTDPTDGAQSEEGRPVRGLTAEAGELFGTDLTSGSLADLTGHTVIIPDALRDRLDVVPGDRLTARFGDRQTERLTVVGTYRPPGFLETLLVPADLAAAHTTDGRPPQLLVGAADGIGQAALLAALDETIAGRPGLVAGDRASLVAAYDDNLRAQSWSSILIVVIVVVYTATAVINSLVVSTLQRRREFGTQRLIGATRVQVLRMVTIESLVALTVAVVLGGAVALASIVPFGLALERGIVPSGPWQIGAGIVGAAALVVVAAALLPTLAMLRRTPAAAVA